MTAHDAAERGSRDAIRHAAVWFAVLPLGGVLGFAVWSLPMPSGGLESEVQERLAQSAVENPVTAVLMNFRGYDTLLELAVLFLALLGVWSSAQSPPGPWRAPGPVLRVLNHLLVPFLILFAGYLLWAGSYTAGGAFQAGAVLGAAGVLITLSGEPLPIRLPRGVERVLIPLGLATFIGAGLATIALGGAFLEYPQRLAKPLTMLIEAAAMVSIGLTLVAVFRGGRPRLEHGGKS